jgi:hypothetical protein
MRRLSAPTSRSAGQLRRTITVLYTTTGVQ